MSAITRIYVLFLKESNFLEFPPRYRHHRVLARLPNADRMTTDEESLI